MRRLLLCLLLTSATLRAQSILTVAGGGPIGDGRPATEALLRLPNDAAFDRSGNLYIADSGNQRVRRVNTQTGIVTTVAGGGTSGYGDGGAATAAEIDFLRGIALDAEGNLYISQFSSIRRVSAQTGIITTIAGGVAGGDYRSLAGLTFDAAGDLIVAEQARHRVHKINLSTGSVTIIAGTGTAGFSGDGGPVAAATLNTPSGVGFDAAGNLYIADLSNHRIRKIAAQTGIITTIAGNGQDHGGPLGDGGPATAASISFPGSLAIDPAGNIYVNSCCGRVRRIDAQTGIITTYAGTGEPDFFGDGGQAQRAGLQFPRGVALDSAGNLHISDEANHRIRKVAPNGIISTVAGGGSLGDGGPATSGQLFQPLGLAVDATNDVYIADSQAHRVRKLSVKTGVISTVAGDGRAKTAGDGGPATSASLLNAFDVAIDTAGNLYVATRFGLVRKIDARTGVITTVVGRDCCPGPGQRFGGDGGPATEAFLSGPQGVAVDSAGNIYVADTENHRVRKVTAATGVISTIAGSGPSDQGSFSGDGGPATSARLNRPFGVALDATGNLYIADFNNFRIRRVDAATGIITTFAGGGNGGDFSPPREVSMSPPTKLAFDREGSLYFAELGHQVRKIDARTGLVVPVAGVAGFGALGPGFSGDGGPASVARLFFPGGVAVDSTGNVYIGDTNNNRIRAVFACVSVAPPSLAAPEDGATGIATSPTLSWSSVLGAFRYDVYLDTNTSLSKLVANDLTVTSFTPSNLVPGTRYYWRVVAKGDPFCVPFSASSSAVRSFTTASGCDAPGAFALTAPADGATNAGSSTLLSWQSAAGVGSYDVFLGPVNPPPLFTTTTSTAVSLSSLLTGTTYYWNVVARASCDRTKTTSTPVRSFTVGGGCPAPGAFVQIAPAPGATGVNTTAALEWSAAANASSYDLYLGTTTPPPVYLLDLSSTKLTISGFAAGRTYYWRVVAKTACDLTRTVSTPISSFTIRSDCQRPQATALTFTPPSSVAVGQSYAVSWSDAAELTADGFYVVERSLTESFATITDSQQTAATSASFLPTSPGVYFHRVRPVNPCNLNQPGANSSARSVNVVPAPPNVIFTVQPQAVLTTLGENLEDKKTRFVLENIGTEPMQVVVGRQEINSPPFFSIVDPFGGDAGFFTLGPRKPKTLEVRFSGPPNDQPAAYQGVIFLAAVGRGLAITPYAFVNLKVGGGPAAPPQFRVGGAETEYVFFPGFSGDDTNRPSISVEVHNPGTTPMELGAEIGPEVWLAPEPGWNSTAIPPGASRTVRLFTRRDRAPHGSALPRYTYLTLRTKTGETARLLVQDNDIAPTGNGRGAALDPSVRSAVLPEVTSAQSPSGNRLFSIVRLTNLANDAVQAELFFTPAGVDGFDGTRVHRATIVVPPNDIVSLTDPLTQLWGLSLPQRGQLEVRAAPEKIGLLAVGTSVIARASGGGTVGYSVPVVGRGTGARGGSPHYLPGVSSNASSRSSLIVAETSGADRAAVRVTLQGADGNARGNRLVEVPRYGYVEIDDVVGALGGGSSLEAGRIDLTVESGGGSIVGVLKTVDRMGDGGSAIVSRLIPPAVSSKVSTLQSSGLMRFIIPSIVNGPLTPQGQPLQTTLGLHGVSKAVIFAVTYRDGQTGAAAATQNVTVQPRQTVEYRNVLEQLFRLPAGAPSVGSLLVEVAEGGEVYARLSSASVQVGKAVITEALPVIPTNSESLTSRSSQRPLYFDGLEQSVDPSRGTRWLLILNESAGAAASVTVRLYEAGNRSAAIAEKIFSLAPHQQLKLDTVFSAMDLDSEDRRKDRTNVLVAVTPSSGDGAVSAVAVSIDNRTGETKTHVLAPSSGPPGSVQKAVIGPQAPARRRPIRRGD